MAAVPCKSLRKRMGRKWLYGVCALCMAAALMDQLMGEGAAKRAMRFLAGVALMDAFVEAALALVRWASG